MIQSFRDDEAKKIFKGQFSKKYQAIAKSAGRKLLLLDAAETLQDLSAIPGLHLEELKRDRKGQFSIRINDQYRVCFCWTKKNDAADVEIVDYH